MMYLSYVPLDVDISQGEKIAPEDLLDAVKTLTLRTKVCIPIPHPGQGPDHFLRWANAELVEAEASPADVASRKAFNCSVLSKCAVECLIDWYLDKYLLNLTLPPYAGFVKKLDALQANDRLSVGLSLFNDVIIGPRNDAIHSYEAVDLKLVRKSVELAKLAIPGCRHAEPPGLAPIFYGTIDLAQGREALEKLAKRDSKQSVHLENPDADGLWLAGIGPKGEVSVLIDRNGPDSRVLLLTSDGIKSAEVRYCPVDRAFGTERLQKLFRLLEQATPRVINVTEQNSRTVVGSLANRSPRTRK